MRIHHIHPLVHWQRLIWFKCKHYGFQFRIEVILWSSWWLKTPTHFFKYAVFKYSASSAHLWSCSEHGMVFWTQRKTAKMSYLYILQKGYRNWFRSIFPMLLGRQSTCLLISRFTTASVSNPASWSEIRRWFWMERRYHELPHLLRAHELQPQKQANHGKSYHMSWDLAGFFLIGNDGRAEGKIQPKEKELFEVSSLSCTRFWSFTCISWKKPPLLEERIQMARGFNGFKFQPWVAPSLLCSSLTRPLLSASVPPATTNIANSLDKVTYVHLKNSDNIW